MVTGRTLFANWLTLLFIDQKFWFIFAYSQNELVKMENILVFTFANLPKIYEICWSHYSYRGRLSFKGRKFFEDEKSQLKNKY